MDDNWIPPDVVELRCAECGALTAFTRVDGEDTHVGCLQCWAGFFTHTLPPASRRLGEPEFSVGPAIARARLYWHAGYISEGRSVFEEAQAVTLSRDATAITLHEHSGWITRFTRSEALDADGCVAFNEMRWHDQPPPPMPPPSAPRLASDETFAYSVLIPPKGRDARCARQNAAANRVHLVGASPRLRFESVGMLPGGGPLSRLCPDIARPAVRGTRVTLSAVEGDDAPASAASFDLDEALVNAFREGDELNVTRTPRGGLALSVLRQGELFVALGAVSAIPLGPDLKVVVRRDRLSKDLPGFGFTNAALPWLHPLEITSGEPPRRPKGFTTRVCYRAWPPPEDADECVTIVRTGACPDVAAFTSTQLLAKDGALRLTWRGHEREQFSGRP